MEGKAEELHIFGNYSFCDSYADIVASMDWMWLPDMQNPLVCKLCMVLHLYA